MDLAALCLPFMFLGYGLIILIVLLIAYYFYSRSRKKEEELGRKMSSDRKNV